MSKYQDSKIHINNEAVLCYILTSYITPYFAVLYVIYFRYLLLCVLIHFNPSLYSNSRILGSDSCPSICYQYSMKEAKMLLWSKLVQHPTHVILCSSFRTFKMSHCLLFRAWAIVREVSISLSDMYTKSV